MKYRCNILAYRTLWNLSPHTFKRMEIQGASMLQVACVALDMSLHTLSGGGRRHRGGTNRVPPQACSSVKNS